MSSHPSDLTRTPRALEWCMHLLVVGLLALTAARALAGDADHPVACAAVAALCAVAYGVGPIISAVRESAGGAMAWLSVVGVVWLGLVALTPDAVWVAFPLYFLQLHLLPRRIGLIAVAVTTVAAIVGFAAHQASFSPAMALGPALGAAVAVAVVWGYQALYRESERRRALIEELTATRAELAAAEHTAGVLAERDRLAREIHDTLAQGFSSIGLLLHAAERSLATAPESTADYIVQAREAAGDNLEEARRFVAALTPPSLDGSTLGAALERLCATTTARHRITARVEIVGEPYPLPTDREVALLRIAQSALSNTIQHADAARADIVLRYGGDEIELAVTDDGCGFSVAQVPGPGAERVGFGLPAMRARVGELSGAFTVESAVGAGTTVSASLPVSAEIQERADD